MKKVFALLFGTSLTLLSGAAFGQSSWSGSYQPAMPAPRDSGLDNLGEEMQVVFGVDRVMGISFDRHKLEPDGGGSRTDKATNVSLFGSYPGAGGDDAVATTNSPRLALDFFVTEGFSIGGSFFVMSTSVSRDVEPDPAGTASGDVGSGVIWGIHPRIGYAMAFDETFSIWPRAGITYWKAAWEDDDGNESNLNGLALTGEVMLGISPFSHFAMLVGPYVDLGVSGTAEDKPSSGPATDVDSTLTSFGLAVSIVAYY
jgi:hypothetical protein